MLKCFGFQLLVGALLAGAMPVSAQEELVGPAHLQVDGQQELAAEESKASDASLLDDKASTPSPVPNFINFGYIQQNSAIPGIRWNAMTHVGTTFVDFLANGSLQNPTSFTGRHSDLRAGGAAQAAGVKVILVVRNDDFKDGSPAGEEDVLGICMQSATNRTNLVNNVRNLVLNDTYCQGVNFDFEFTWDAATRDGITAFMQAMRAALPNHELSVYTHATYVSSRWNIAALEPTIDYMIYSTYDWASGTRAHAISDFNNCIPHINSYLNAGLPPHKMVLAWASYSRRWAGATGYDTNGTPNSQGFTNGLYDTTLEPQFGGPFTSNYVLGDEAEWYNYSAGGTNYTVTWDSPASLEMKIRAAVSMPPGGTGTTHRGKRLGGVAWWSLHWFSNFTSSYNPIAGQVQSRTRTYPHIYQLAEEILSAPGDKRFIFEGFESLNPRWTDPNESPDTTGANSSSNVALITKPAGGPANSSKAARLNFNFTASSGNRMFFRHEVLRDNGDTNITDVNSAVCHVDSTTAFIAPYHVAGNYSNRTIRMALLDGNRQVEVSPAVALPSVAGWYEVQWDLTDPAQIQAYDTNEPAFLDGNGVLNTAGGGARDIRFLGFIIQGGPSGSGNITFDELAYEHRNPGGKQYTINEFRYAVATQEFVEIHGPPGAFPAGMQLRFYDSANGQVLSSVNLGGRSIPASGLYVVGDTGVPNTTGSNGFVPTGWGAADNIPNVDPSAIQLFDTSNACVYDSVTYEAMGGLDDLARKQTHGVTAEGFGWIGEIGPGTNAQGQSYTMGRFPDGADTQVNQTDFSFMPPSPGASNGSSIALGTTLNFDTTPASVYQSYQSPALVNPANHSIPASPGGGNVWRVVDTTGGGVVGMIGDAGLGVSEGYTVTGEIYIPAGGAPTQALTIGFCGNDGSTFFATNPDNSGYESGYWLTYQHGSVNLNDDQSNHSGAFRFIHATNDNMHRTRSTILGGNRTLGQLGTTAGSWTTFRLRIDPTHATDKLIAQINNVDVYRGAIPAGGPTSGAVQIGFRETGGGVAANEGTFVDTISIQSNNPVPPPDAPSSLNAGMSENGILLTWIDNSTNETEFVIERKRDDEGEFTELTTIPEGSTSYEDTTNLVEPRQYCYRVKAENTGGSSTYSNEACVTFDKSVPVIPPNPPSDLMVTPVEGGAQLDWVDNSTTEEGFVIERRRSDAIDFSELTSVGPNVVTYTDTQVQGGFDYCYQVKAFLGEVESGYSNVACLTIEYTPQDQYIDEVPNPGDAGDNFGFSLAPIKVGKQVGIIVGAPGVDDGETTDVGRAYLFYPPNTTPALIIENPAPIPGAESSYFGYSVSSLGASILVGSPGPETPYGGGGSVYMFDAVTGDLQRTLTASVPVPGDRFGQSVSGMGKQEVVVGVPANQIDSGKAYLFNLKKETVVEVEDTATSVSDQFGRAVAAGKGRFGVVGLDTLCSPGNVDVFKKNGQLFASLPDAYSIASLGNKFIVGSPPQPDCAPGINGFAYLLAGKKMKMIFINQVDTDADGFGFAVAGGKKFASVGAPFYDEPHTDDTGRAYLFRTKSSYPVAIYFNPFPGVDDAFGHAMAIAEGIRLPSKQKINVIAVGAPFSDRQSQDGGGVYYYLIPPN